MEAIKDFFRTIFTYNFFKVFIYFVFVFSGSMKWIPSPIDITVLSFGVCLLVLAYELRRIPMYDISSRNVYKMILGVILLFLISNIYTIANEPVIKKNVAMGINIFGVVFPLIAFKKTIFKELKTLMHIVAGVIIILLSYLYFNDMFIIFFDKTRAIENVPTYLQIGVLLSASFLFSLDDKFGVVVLIYRLLILFFLSQLGGRGPIINLFLCLFIFYFLNRKNIKYTYKTVLFGMAVIVGMFLYLDTIITLILENVNVDRFTALNAESTDGSVTVRLEYLEKGLNSFYSSPIIGHGIASGGILLTGIDQVEFPHNLFVEALMEVGILGGFLYAGIYLYLFIKNFKLIRVFKPLLIVFMVALLFFLEDMKSGSFDAWRVALFWILLFLVEKKYHNYYKIN